MRNLCCRFVKWLNNSVFNSIFDELKGVKYFKEITYFDNFFM